MKIVNKNYEVQIKPSLVTKDGRVLDGIVWHDPVNVIYIRAGLSGREFLETIVHEIMHCIMYQKGDCADIYTVEDLEEKVVDAMAAGLCDVLESDILPMLKVYTTPLPQEEGVLNENNSSR